MKKLIFLTIMSLTSIMLSAQINNDIIGVWVTEGGESKIEIYERDGEFIGKVVFIHEKNYVNGKPDLDRKNPNKELRNRSLLGMVILEGFEYDEDDNELKGGKIYNPESGKSYDAFMRMKDINTLKVKGYVAGMRWLGKSVIWKRDVPEFESE